MKKYIIQWDAGNGSYHDEIEAENEEGALQQTN